MRNTIKSYNIKRSLSVTVRLLLLVVILLPHTLLFAQQKTKKQIEIKEADVLLFDDTVVKNAQRLIGDVKLIHENTVIFCDSAWKYTNSNMVDAFGKVHIISNDTLDLWASFINYDGASGLAKARMNVKLKDPSLTLTTDSLDFDMNEEIGYYDCGGTIVDSANVLTSVVGRYYTKKNELFFTDSVKLVNDDYTITTDTMMYNTQTEIVNFSGPTRIIGDSTYIYSTSGWFNTQTNESELHKNSTMRRANTQLQADYIYYNDNTGDGNASGNVVMNDFANQMIVAGQKANYDDFNQYAMVTDSAVWIQYYEGDSLFLHADTLYTIPDTSAVDAKMLITYPNVRFFRTDIQGICDSLIYFTKDSTIQLYQDPVIWSDQNQMSANFIEFKNNSRPPNEVYLNDNSFIIQENDSMKFNQIKGKNMVGLIKGQTLFRIDVNGNGQSIYYPADEKDYIGINKAESSKIILYLVENQINRISFIGSPVGIMNPLPDKITPETRLDGFKWRADERPNSRFDIFGDYEIEAQPSALPVTNIDNILPNVQEMLLDIAPSDSLINIQE